MEEVKIVTHERAREVLYIISRSGDSIELYDYIDQQEKQEKELQKMKKLLELNEKLNSEVFELLFAQDNIHYDDDMIKEIQNNIDKLEEQIKELENDLK